MSPIIKELLINIGIVVNGAFIVVNRVRKVCPERHCRKLLGDCSKKVVDCRKWSPDCRKTSEG